MSNELELFKLLGTGGAGMAVAVVALKGYDVVVSVLKERRGGGETAEHAPRQECLREFSRINENLVTLTNAHYQLDTGRRENGEKMARIEGTVDALRDEVRAGFSAIGEHLNNTTRRIDGVINGRH
jgi:hypothetical protein